MAFGDVKTPKGLQELDNFLADNSYISGWVEVMQLNSKFNFSNLVERKLSIGNWKKISF